MTTAAIAKTKDELGRRAGRPHRLVALLPAMVLGITDAALADYVESFQTWSASSAATWEEKDLSGATFNVPAEAVVEVAITNSNSTNARSGGVRAVGSSLERRFLLHAVDAAGHKVVAVMHVQTDACSQIQHYAENTTDVEFILLGYWDAGTYVERFDTMTAGANASWQELDLSGFGLGAVGLARTIASLAVPDSAPNFAETGRKEHYDESAMA